MRKLFTAFAFIALMAVTSLQARADGIDVFLNDRTVNLDYLASYRGADLEYGFLFNQAGDWVGDIGLLVLGKEYGKRSKLEGGFGIKGFVASVGNQMITAIGLGGQLTYFPGSSRLGFGAYVYFAPDIVTFGGRRFVEQGLRMEFQMMDTASMFIGFHGIIVESNLAANTIVDDGLHIGVRLKF